MLIYDYILFLYDCYCKFSAFRSMTSTEFWSIQDDIKKTDTSISYFKPSNIQDWLVLRHYPTLNLTKRNFSWTVAQHFNISSYGKWWIPINLVMNGYLHQNIYLWLTARYPYYIVDYIMKNDWLIINNQQAGKYQ